MDVSGFFGSEFGGEIGCSGVLSRALDPILNGNVLMWGVLWYCLGDVLQLFETVADIIADGDVNIAILIVPIQG